MAPNHYRQYKCICFIDSNILLEGLPLQELPWNEVDTDGPILVLLAPTVLSEVDAKKRDGRLGPRAREVNRQLRPLVEGVASIEIKPEAPRVELGLASWGKIPWDTYDDLDKQEGDDRLVAEIVNCRDIPVDRATFVSQDINPLIKAKRHGVRTVHASTNWLPAPEPSPAQKEIARLKQQISDFQKSQPDFEVSLDFDQLPIKVYDIAPLTENQAADFRRRILEANPKIEQDRSSILSGLSYDHTYDKRYSKYKSERVPSYVERYHAGLTVLFNQTPVHIRVKNMGRTRAEHLLVEIKIIGGWLNDNPISFPIAGISGPRPDRSMAMHSPPDLRSLIARREEMDRHAVSVTKIKRASVVSAQCEDFRQGETWEIDPILWLETTAPDSTIVIKITAANFTGEKRAVFKPIRTLIKANALDLVSELSPKAELKENPIVAPIITQAYEAQRYSDVDYAEY